MAEHQPSLFSAADVQGGRYRIKPNESLALSQEALTAWKQRIFRFQQQVKVSAAVQQQGTLFDWENDAEPRATVDPESIHPFGLPQQNTEFWRWKAEDHGIAALYFVIDYELPILLYVGETVKSNQRWKGEHDCKRYLLNYRQAHYQHQLTSMLGIAFWMEAPVETRSRQAFESALIYKWRSPFNKENWKFWGTPFVGGH
ncbi:GIY-YIG nuclease family protein [Oculatella sp. LEGE 06141]|uniref:GIY-YIG nuclease family protein n=1 Tax=Oculatella sp. LEGE 06141 TaxID=1828648 RepID=UPI0018810F27|nr:GIY-YIG nuclease family protein [Oculatella sp. LEGE 06141]MBE9181580.1 GIY-YIG nuclease family protein [Oculatella sp. LEGE 06141]